MSLKVDENTIVVPGELVGQGDFKKGDGITKVGDQYYSSLVGMVIRRGNKIRVRPLKGRYYPSVGDMVIGYIEDVNLTSFIVNIGGPYSALLLASNASRRRFDPIKDDLRKIYDVGDVIRAEIVSFDRTRDPQLATKYQGLGKLRDGQVIHTNPNHMARIIGKKGSMIQMIKNATNTRIIVGKNGRVWIKGEDSESENKVAEVIYKISREAHVRGLTERISKLLTVENGE